MLLLNDRIPFGQPVRKVFNGKAYWVTPMVMAVPGIMNGSMGPKRYGPLVLATRARAWNGMPVTYDHPRDQYGAPISYGDSAAKDPPPVPLRDPAGRDPYGPSSRQMKDDGQPNYALGFVWNVHFDGKLKGEAWLDEEKLQRAGLLQRVQSAQPMEVSTGLYGWPEEGDEVLDLIPDHMALLPNGTGACSIKDGCGLFMNEAHRVAGLFMNEASREVGLFMNEAYASQPIIPTYHGGGGPVLLPLLRSLFWMPPVRNARPVSAADSVHAPDSVNKRGDPVPLTLEEKAAHVRWLTVNCACWRKPGDDAILNNLPDDKVVELYRSASAPARPAANDSSSITSAPMPPAPGGAQPTTPAGTPSLGQPGRELAKPQLSEQEIQSLAEEIARRLGLPAQPGGLPAYKPAQPPTMPAGGGQAGNPTHGGMGGGMMGHAAGGATLPVAAPLTANDWLLSAPAPIREAWEASMALVQNQKAQLADRLVAHVTDPAARQGHHAQLMARSIQDLSAMVAFMPPAPISNGLPPRPLYHGAAGVPAWATLTDNEGADVLDLEAARSQYDPARARRQEGAAQTN